MSKNRKTSPKPRAVTQNSNFSDISECLVEFALRNGGGSSRGSSRPSTASKSQHHLQHDGRKLLQFYEDDELVRVSPEGKIQFGLVAYGDGDRKEDDAKSKGAISSRAHMNSRLQIFWTLAKNVEIQELDFSLSPPAYDNIRLIDRKVEKGDLIRVSGWGSSSDTMRDGEVIDMKFVACVKCMENNEAIIDIPCENLQPVLAYRVGDKLVIKGWFGVITSLEIRATLILSNGSFCNINLNKISPNSLKTNKIYPGSNVAFTLEEYLAAGADKLDSGESLSSFFGGIKKKIIPAFVAFMKVDSVQVDWKLRLPISLESEDLEVEPKPSENENRQEPPSKTVQRSTLKKYARVLHLPTELIWAADNNDLPAVNIYETYYRYTVQPGDKLLVDSAVNMERLLLRNLFPEKWEHHYEGRKVQQSDAVPNVTYVVQVLRTARVLNVQWDDSETVEAVRSASVSEKYTFGDPYHQIVQIKLPLQTYEGNLRFGVTLSRHINDTVTVQWFEQRLDTEVDEVKGIFPELSVVECTIESKFDLEPHFLYGDITMGEIVYRSSTCKLPTVLFTYGVVQRVTAGGFVIVQNPLTKKEFPLFPFEICVIEPMKSADEEFYEKLTSNSLASTTDFDAQQLTGNLLANYNLAKILPPSDEKFKLYQKAPKTHKFYRNVFKYTEEYLKVVNLDREVLSNIFTEGIWVRGFKDRGDLYSAMVTGGDDTPYEDGLFHFDIQLPSSYTKTPPQIYLTTILPRSSSKGSGFYQPLAPGRVDFHNAPVTVLEALLDIQRTYFHDVNFRPMTRDSKNCGLTNSDDKSTIEKIQNRNARIVVEVIDLLLLQLAKPPTIWKDSIVRYVHNKLPTISARLKKLLELDASYSEEKVNPVPFYILPLSQGFMQAAQNRINMLNDLMSQTEVLQQLV